jgi:two-component system sensor histidine kinase KdpD
MSSLLTGGRPRNRRTLGLVAGAVGLVACTAVLAPGRSLIDAALLYLVPVVAVAVLGGVWLGMATAVVAAGLLNWFFIPPYQTFAVDRRDNLVALLVYALVAVTVSVAVDLAARQRAAAVRSGLEARLLARITAAPVAGESLTRLLGHIRETFGMRAVALVESGSVVASAGELPAGPVAIDPDHGTSGPVVASAGEPPAGSVAGGPRDGTTAAAWAAAGPALTVEAAENLHLLLYGPPLFAEDRRLLGQLAAGAARTLEAQRLAEQAARAEQLAEVDRLRTAILAAVGHDLRTPLAGIKAAASSLRAPDVAFSDDDRAELLATIDESTDRLGDLVENLLAMSRLQAGVLSVDARPVAVDEIVARALLHAGANVMTSIDDALPLVLADPGLLERVVANLVDNAIRASDRVTVRASASPSTVDVQVVDRGDGIPAGDRDRIFAPFQRLDDRTAGGGLGLGLAIVRGFTEAMGGTVVPSDTPGGGLTMTVTLPRAVT